MLPRGGIQRGRETHRETPGRAKRGETLALVDASAGKDAKAGEELAAVLAGANDFGYVSYRLEIRLALAQMGLRSSQPSARTQPAALEKDADEKGFLLIARKAAGPSRAPMSVQS